MAALVDNPELIFVTKSSNELAVTPPWDAWYAVLIQSNYREGMNFMSFVFFINMNHVLFEVLYNLMSLLR